MSHDNAHFLLSCSLPYPGPLYFEVFVRLRIRIVSQGVVCVLSVVFCGFLLFWLCFVMVTWGGVGYRGRTPLERGTCHGDYGYRYQPIIYVTEE